MRGTSANQSPLNLSIHKLPSFTEILGKTKHLSGKALSFSSFIFFENRLQGCIQLSRSQHQMQPLQLVEYLCHRKDQEAEINSCSARKIHVPKACRVNAIQIAMCFSSTPHHHGICISLYHLHYPQLHHLHHYDNT